MHEQTLCAGGGVLEYQEEKRGVLENKSQAYWSKGSVVGTVA